MATAIIQQYPPSRIGPTWQFEDGQWLLPEYTLGWEIVAWIETELESPDGTGDPFVLTPEQTRFVLWYYAIDERGNFIYRHGVLQRLKGWGKDPLSSALAVVELCGPARFSHWDENGEPIGRPVHSPLVQIAAVSKEQIVTTLFSLFPLVIPMRTRAKYKLDVQRELIYVQGGRGKLQAIGVNARSNEGGRVTFFLAGEIHHWTQGNGAKALYRTAYNNMGKIGGRFLAITNAFQPGEESVLEDIRTSQQKVWDGLRESDGLLYDSLEAHPDSPLEPDVAPYIIRTIAGDSSWLYGQIPDIVRGFTDESVPPSVQRRMWFNQLVSSEESAFTTSEVEKAVRPGCLGTMSDLNRGDKITLGFDGGRTDDATALVAYRPADGLVVPIQVWEKPDHIGDWEIDQDDVDSQVHLVFQLYDVQAFYADVAGWESSIATWSDLYRETLVIKASAKSAIGWDMRGNKQEIATLNETLIGMIRSGNLQFNGNARLRAHILNAERRYNNFGITFGKKGGRESKHKIDALIAMSLAVKASLDLAESGKKKKRKGYSPLYQW